jgi:hypothetical protein
MKTDNKTNNKIRKKEKNLEKNEERNSIKWRKNESDIDYCWIK